MNKINYSKFIIYLSLFFILSTNNLFAIECKSVDVHIENKYFNVTYIKAKLNKIKIKVGLAKGLVGQTESLSGIAKRYKAVAAINGCFFDAYTKSTIKNPHHTLITDSQFVHIGNVGTTLGFDKNNNYKMERVIFKIDGGRNNSYKYPDHWYAYWLNRLTESKTVTIFTKYWGKKINMPNSTQISVSNGKVISINNSFSEIIPENGYVICIRDIKDSSLSDFAVGQDVEYKIIKKDNTPMDFWDTAVEGICAGPRLVTDGKITVNPAEEGFSHKKILSLSGSRSAVGLTCDGYILFATTNSTIKELALIMKKLGSYNAMNLDGGASSGLWLKGKYIVEPGRDISNALLLTGK